MDNYDIATINRLAQKTVKLEDECCWPWVGTTKKGYGLIYYRGRNHTAHRIAYLLNVSREIDGLHIDHLCANRWCVNPNHLEAVTRRENIIRGVSPVGMNYRKTECLRGHSLADAYINAKGGRVCKTCSAAKWQTYYTNNLDKERTRRSKRI